MRTGTTSDVASPDCSTHKSVPGDPAPVRATAFSGAAGGGACPSSTDFTSGWDPIATFRSATMALTRTPSLAIQLINESSMEESQTLPSLVRGRPCESFFGTPLWWRATTCQNRLKAGDPEDPAVVSVMYQTKSSTYFRSLFSRTHTCLVCPPGCWMMVRYSPGSPLPGSPLRGSHPHSESMRAPSREAGATA